VATSSDESKADRLYLKALGIRYEHRIGLWMPVMWHLALRRHEGAMIELADWFSRDGGVISLGSPWHGFSAAGLYRRAYKAGDARAAHNLAVSYFNQNDLARYRYWLRRAALAGDAGASNAVGRFETRLWHGAARKIRRIRPMAKRDC
jgi:hypothetical protein